MMEGMRQNKSCIIDNLSEYSSLLYGGISNCQVIIIILNSNDTAIAETFDAPFCCLTLNEQNHDLRYLKYGMKLLPKSTHYFLWYCLLKVVLIQLKFTI